MKDNLAGFWKRIFAFLIDIIILGVVGTLIGFAFYGFLSSLHTGGRLIGFVIAGLYFAIMSSRDGGGQTIGMRACKIKLVDRNGQMIDLRKSAIRFLIFGTPYFLNGVGFGLETTTFGYWVLGFIGLILSSVTIGIVYLYIANKSTRQSLHDLATGTYVCKSEVAEPLQPVRVAKINYIVLGCIPVVMVLLSLLGLSWMNGNQTLIQLQSLIVAAENEPGVWQANATNLAMHRISSTSHETITNLTVTAFCDHACADDVKEKIAADVLTIDPTISGADRLNIVTAKGYDIGIASFHDNDIESHTLEEWKYKLSGGAK